MCTTFPFSFDIHVFFFCTSFPLCIISWLFCSLSFIVVILFFFRHTFIAYHIPYIYESFCMYCNFDCIYLVRWNYSFIFSAYVHHLRLSLICCNVEMEKEFQQQKNKNKLNKFFSQKISANILKMHYHKMTAKSGKKYGAVGDEANRCCRKVKYAKRWIFLSHCIAQCTPCQALRSVIMTCLNKFRSAQTESLIVDSLTCVSI